MIQITDTITIDEAEIQETFVHSSGPGGQNVNKTATAVQLRFDAAHSSALPEDVRQRVLRLAGNRLTRDGVLVNDARRYRTQERNRQDALDRLIALIRQATHAPKPRRRTHPTRASRQRRLETKRQRGETKRQRRAVPEDL